MFKNLPIKYFKIKDNKLFVKYKYTKEEFLTSSKVDLEEFKNRKIIDKDPFEIELKYRAPTNNKSLF